MKACVYSLSKQHYWVYIAHGIYSQNTDFDAILTDWKFLPGFKATIRLPYTLYKLKRDGGTWGSAVDTMGVKVPR